MSKPVSDLAPAHALPVDTAPTHEFLPKGRRSIEDVHRSVAVPGGHWFRRMLAFGGPAYLVAVGYMDPGNWATDLAGGSIFGYRLIWVLLMSNLMAVLLQTLSARLGLVTGRDLAQACRDAYSPPVRIILFVLCEIAIAACDLAEVLGTALGLNLLTAQFGWFGGQGIPLVWAVMLTGLDVLVLLTMQRWGIRKMEAFILSLVAMIGACFIVEIFLSRPEWSGVARGFIPRPLSLEGGDQSSLYIAIGILGATVMPHNLYLHSALVQTRRVARTRAGVAQACRYNLIDSAIALNAAFFVNAAILIVAAATFFSRGMRVAEIREAHALLDSLLGTKATPIAFALALLCAGQSSTITGTLAGQITMEGFVHLRVRPWVRRLITRSLAIAPAIVVISLTGDNGASRLLILSQVVLSLQLSFAVIPLVKFTGSREKMGPFATPRGWLIVAWLVAAIIAGLNGYLVAGQIFGWADAAGRHGWLVYATVGPVAAGLALLLLWMTFRRESAESRTRAASAEVVASAALSQSQQFRRIGVALDASDTDAAMLAEAVALARAHRAELVLMHVVEGVGGQWYGHQADDAEYRHDEQYLKSLADHLRASLQPEGVPDVRASLGFGPVAPELVRLAGKEEVDLMVAGGHGHRGLTDLLKGQTIDTLRHGVKVPVLAVKGAKPWVAGAFPVVPPGES